MKTVNLPLATPDMAGPAIDALRRLPASLGQAYWSRVLQLVGNGTEMLP
jgi:hypothetical protein